MTTQIVTCSYCLKDYYDVQTHVTLADRIMCVDCYESDVPAVAVA